MESLAQLSPTLQACLAGIFGLLVGSFLNVVITRLPVMMMRQWRAEAREALELEAEDTPRFNLLVPASRCPGCDTPIKWHDNLPILGWLKRRGRCASCNTRISAQYPLVELAGGALGASIALIYGLEAQSLWIFGACLTLLVLSVIDFRTQLLPDAITLPLLWAGLAYQLLFQPLMLPSAVIGAMAGYLVLWSFYWLFKLVTGKEGMGYGDFKLLAALGAWVPSPEGQAACDRRLFGQRHQRRARCERDDRSRGGRPHRRQHPHPRAGVRPGRRHARR